MATDGPSYKLTFEVIDEGKRTFISEPEEFRSQGDMARLMPYDVIHAISVLNWRPSLFHFIAAFVDCEVDGSDDEDYKLLYVLSAIYEVWNKDGNFSDLFSDVTIDLSKIRPEMKSTEAIFIRSIAEDLGWKVLCSDFPPE